MSLRVLLADESASIKKVFQLGLQDFAAEVKTVQSGIDVIEVAESFNPDIIFADILLQKKNGYDVSKELKKHATLNSVPVVLMWSSFMELDPQKYQESLAEGEMEKPFEVDAMRSHIQNLVQKAKDQQLSSFLKFPGAIKEDFVQEFEEQKESYKSEPPQLAESDEEPEASNIIIPPAPPVAVDGVELSAAPPQPMTEEEPDEVTQNSIFNQPLDDFSAELEKVEDEAPPATFDATEEPPAPPPIAPPSEDVEAFELTHDEVAVDEWSSKPLSDTQLSEDESEPSEEIEMDQFQSVELKADEDLKLDDFLYKPDSSPEEEKPPIVDVKMDSEADNASEPAQIQVNHDEIEAIVRAHAQEIIKMNIQEMLPQIIEKVTREELDKLLKDELKMKS